MSYTPEQVIALAPNAASAKAGQSLATARKWSARGCDERAVWGECLGSGREPYRTQIDLAEPAFRCSCPSHKFPCKQRARPLPPLRGRGADLRAVSAHDLASSVVGAVIKDPVQDSIVWREYLETVVKERDGWKDLYRACRDQE